LHLGYLPRHFGLLYSHRLSRDGFLPGFCIGFRPFRSSALLS
jgi:hypothetical protein